MGECRTVARLLSLSLRVMKPPSRRNRHPAPDAAAHASCVMCSSRSSSKPSSESSPDDLAAIVTRIEANARARLQDLRSALAEQRDLREVFMALFPDGLTFTPTRTHDGERKIWKITGKANLHPLLGGVGSDCIATPTGFEPVLPA
jgi:hypothetical protein